MKTAKQFFVFLAAVFAVFLLLFIAAKVPTTAKTDKFSYSAGEPVEVTLNNREKNDFCFSSCYPFYIESKENNAWKKIGYSQCLQKNIAENCLAKRSKKAFEFFLSDLLPKGEYRLAIPLCDSCKVKDSFLEEKWVYSNKFRVSK